MSDVDFQVRDVLIDQFAEMINRDPVMARWAGLPEAMIEVLSDLTPARRAYIHQHFMEMFGLEPYVLEVAKQRLRPN